MVVTPGTRHNFLNTGSEPLRIYTIYVPPNHIDGRVHRTKADADADQADEEFGHSRSRLGGGRPGEITMVATIGTTVTAEITATAVDAWYVA